MSKFNLSSLLNKASLDSGGHEGHKSLKVEYLSVRDLIPSKANFYSVDYVEELKNSIEMFGIMQNLTVLSLDNGKYKIIAGHRRHLASLSLVAEGKTEYEMVPCSVETELDHIKEQLLLITTNATARQLSDYEKVIQAEKIKELLKSYRKSEKITGRTRDLIAQMLDTSPAQVGRMESISKNLDSRFKEAFKTQEINVSTAYELSKLPHEEQKSILKTFEDSGSLSIKEVKDKKKALATEGESNQQADGQMGMMEFPHCLPSEFEEGLESNSSDIEAEKTAAEDDKPKEVIFKLPCVPGQEVYFLDSTREREGRKNVTKDFVNTGVIDHITIGGALVPIITVCDCENIWVDFNLEDDLGRCCFLSYEEAAGHLMKEAESDV